MCVLWHSFIPLYFHSIIPSLYEVNRTYSGFESNKYILFILRTHEIHWYKWSCHSSCLRTLPFLFLRNWQQLRQYCEGRLVRLTLLLYDGLHYRLEIDSEKCGTSKATEDIYENKNENICCDSTFNVWLECIFIYSLVSRFQYDDNVKRNKYKVFS